MHDSQIVKYLEQAQKTFSKIDHELIFRVFISTAKLVFYLTHPIICKEYIHFFRIFLDDMLVT